MEGKGVAGGTLLIATTAALLGAGRAEQLRRSVVARRGDASAQSEIDDDSKRIESLTGQRNLLVGAGATIWGLGVVIELGGKR